MVKSVNCVKDAEYHETSSAILNTVFTQLFNVENKEVYIHDPEVSNDQPDELIRVLDDSPDREWHEFLVYHTRDECHRGHVKTQKCHKGCMLYKVVEGYPDATQLPPLYLLVSDA